MKLEQKYKNVKMKFVDDADMKEAQEHFIYSVVIEMGCKKIHGTKCQVMHLAEILFLPINCGYHQLEVRERERGKCMLVNCITTMCHY